MEVVNSKAENDDPLKTLRSLREVEREHITLVLGACDWCQTKAARILQIDRKTLRSKINEFGLTRPL